MQAFFKSLRIGAWALGLGLPAAHTAHAESWIKIESDHFIIYSNRPDAVVRDYILKMEAFDQAADLLFSEIGDSEIPEDQKHVFYYLRKMSDFSTVSPKSSNSFTPERSCYSYGYQSYSVAEYLNAKSSFKEINPTDLSYLYRSYTQTKIAKYFSFPVPTWVREGMKEYFMTLKVDKDRIYVGLPFTQLSYTPYDASTLMPFEAILNDKYPRNGLSETTRLQWWVMINYLLTDPVRREKFSNYLSRLQKGEDSVEAFKAAIGMAPEDFKKIYRDYASKGAPYLTYPYQITPDSNVSAVTLPDYDAPLPLINSALSLSPCITEAHGKSLLGRARKVAEAFTGDGLAALTLAKAETHYGDPAAAVAILEPLATKTPDNAEVLHVLGKAYMAMADKVPTADRAGLMAKARSVLARAYKLVPSSPSVLYDLAKSRKDLPGYPDENTMTAAETAWEYAANMSFHGFIGVYVAELYVSKDRYADALAIMEPWLSEDALPPVKAALQKAIDKLKAKAPKAETQQAMEDYLKACNAD